MNFRYLTFLTYDALNGAHVRNTVNDISYHIENNLFNADALENLLKTVTEQIPFYQKYHGKKLSDFPVINKSTFSENPNMVSPSIGKGKSVTSHTTSGSTGTPFTILYDNKKRLRHRAALIYWNNRAKAPIGQKLLYLRVWNQINRKSHLRQVLENIIPIEISHFEQPQVHNLLKLIDKQKSALSILGFSSALIELSKHVNTGYNISPVRSIIAMSEHLPESIRKKLQQQFGCPVFARYSNMENGFIAQQFDESGEYLINTSDFYIEILKLDEDVPVANGETGRIVVTDLYNYVMPFIRYDTGDLGSVRIREDGKYVFTSIEGRKCDVIFDAMGKIVSPHAVTNSLWSYKEIVQFQFIQRGVGDYVLKLNLNGAQFLRETELRDVLSDYFGDNIKITFEYVNEIPVLNSGKRKYIVNEMS